MNGAGVLTTFLRWSLKESSQSVARSIVRGHGQASDVRVDMDIDTLTLDLISSNINCTDAFKASCFSKL